MASSAEVPIDFIRLTPRARIPRRATFGAAGLDLFSPTNYWIPPYHTISIPTDIALAIPLGFYGRLASRSGLAARGLHVMAGVIDSDYRGNVHVLLANLSNQGIDIHTGDAMAQLIIERCAIPKLQEKMDLPPTSRGTGGFGSTGC